ncbi:hypothetical protein ACIQVT_05555 [Streptomyces sp. NPDC100445]|uniref:hypothetical protein n=1 Tax=Streptomyces sp. NPDC100445 TaxID=3366102 RepID=UPI0037FC4B2F
MPDGRLLRRLWMAAMSASLPLRVVMWLVTVVDDGLSRQSVGDLVLAPAVWALLGLLLAGCVHGARFRQARGTGVAVTPDALADTRERLLPAGAAERLRAGLAGSGRAYDVVDGEVLEFRWRPFRGRHTITGSAASGGVLLRLRVDGAPRGIPGQRNGGAFVALCQVTRPAAAE